MPDWQNFQPFIVSPELHAAAVLEGNEEAGHGRVPLEPTADQVELFDHQRMEQPAHIGAGGHPIPGPGLLQGTRATNPVPALQHQHSPAGPGQVGGAGETVMSRADYNGVPASGGQLFDRG